MIEQDMAELWRRATSPTAPWDGAAAREALRAMGLDPYAPPPEFAARGPGDGEPAQESAAEAGFPSSLGEGIDGWGLSAGEPVGEEAPAAADIPHPNPSPEGEGLFAPAPRKVRHHEWTRPKMVAFLRELAACQNVSQAARSVGMGRQSAYRLRDRMGGTPFALAWEGALECGVQQLAHALMDRALNGEEVPVFYQGEQVGSQRRFDNRLATWLIENHGKLGRQPVARANVFAAGEWEALLERIEWDSFDWDEGEALSCAPCHLQAPDARDAAGAGGRKGRGGAGARLAAPPSGG